MENLKHSITLAFIQTFCYALRDHKSPLSSINQSINGNFLCYRHCNNSRCVGRKRLRWPASTLKWMQLAQEAAAARVSAVMVVMGRQVARRQ